MDASGPWLVASRDVSPWRAVAFIATLGLIGVVWYRLQSRWAPRTIASWSGSGIREDLTAAQAAVLLRVDPALTVAAALEPFLASGMARVTSHVPLRIEWEKPPPAQIAGVFDDDGRLDFDGACALLEALHAEVEEVMAPFSGRRTAVHHRNAIRRRWEGHFEGAPVTGRDWLLLLDPAKVWDRIPTGPTGEILHDLVRLGGLFRRAMPRDLLVVRARKARGGYFAYRSDLRRGRAGTTASLDVDSDRRVPPRTPLARTIDGLARALEGTASGYEPDLGRVPIAIYLTSIQPSVGGRFDGRAVSVRFRADDRVTMQLACVSDRRFEVERAADASALPPGLREGIEACRPFDSLRVGGGTLECRAEMDSGSIGTEDVLGRLRRLDALSRLLEG